jgi:hypothetical protein
VADFLSIISANYKAVGASTSYSKTPYLPIEPTFYEGSWAGVYANKEEFHIQISGITGFRAHVSYQSGRVHLSQDVLIKDNSFRIGDSKFTITKVGVAQVKTVMTDPATGAQTLHSASAKKQT